MCAENVYQVNAVQRACEILKCFTLAKPVLSLVEISKLTNIPKPTVFRILSTLMDARLVQKSADGNKYQVGIMSFELGSIYIGHLSIERIARPFMNDLTETYGMSTNLGMLDDGKVVYLGASDPHEYRRYNSIIGFRHYIHCSAMGKILASAHDDDDVKAILEKHGMPPLSKFTLTEIKDYLHQLAEVREHGYAVDDQESAVGMFCLAAPIRDHEGQIRFAMSLSGAKPLFTDTDFPTILADLNEAAHQISLQLGWRDLA